ncbi:MAG: type III-B CRISPR-associated protein Cas10/Cmr2 [Lachnospiraceae bacterium]|nr:type III-B CRISPR-associated protein Cas10/Cmr2 [Lachnospiraceae bacterium]
MEKFLLLYTVGPVQSYIAQAVKLHDLYSGSRMLSKTIEIAMKKICDMEPQNKIIFPYYKESVE